MSQCSYQSGRKHINHLPFIYTLLHFETSIFGNSLFQQVTYFWEVDLQKHKQCFACLHVQGIRAQTGNEQQQTSLKIKTWQKRDVVITKN